MQNQADPSKTHPSYSSPTQPVCLIWRSRIQCKSAKQRTVNSGSFRDSRELSGMQTHSHRPRESWKLSGSFLSQPTWFLVPPSASCHLNSSCRIFSTHSRNLTAAKVSDPILDSVDWSSDCPSFGQVTINCSISWDQVLCYCTVCHIKMTKPSTLFNSL